MPIDLMSEAQDALARLDNGHDLPGDQQLADAYDQHCQQQWGQIEADRANAEYETWLATQCQHCGPDGASGEPCDDCWQNAELGALELAA